MKILGIESTCDETGAAVVENGTKVLANSLATSALEHARFGGVVPEVAAREQVKVLVPTLASAVKDVNFDSIDAIAVSYGPGLIGSLLVGVESAKALALAWEKPLIPVNHLVGHIYSNWLEAKRLPQFPLIGLVVSGGHTDLVYMRNSRDFNLIGSTLDDAAGEAFDKVARYLGLPYPGGPQIEKAAIGFCGVAGKNPFPVSMAGKDNSDFSFSGIKTAVVRYVEKNHLKLTNNYISMVAFYFENAVVDSIASRVKKSATSYKVRSLVIGGGVAANKRLRRALLRVASETKTEVYFPKIGFSVDNGAMIAAAAFFAGKPVDPLTIQADSGLHFD